MFQPKSQEEEQDNTEEAVHSVPASRQNVVNIFDPISQSSNQTEKKFSLTFQVKPESNEQNQVTQKPEQNIPKHEHEHPKIPSFSSEEPKHVVNKK